MLPDDFERCALWPIHLDLPHGRGYSLWGSGGLEADQLLATPDSPNRRLLVFTHWTALRTFVHEATACNFSRTPGYSTLAALFQAGPPSVASISIRHFPLVSVRGWLHAPRWNWPLSRCATILDCVNLLWDAARTLDDPEALQSFRDHAPLALVADALTFIDAPRRQSILSALPATESAAAYDQILTRLSRRTEIENADSLKRPK